MLLEIVVLGVVGFAVVGILETSAARLDRPTREGWTAVALIREGLRGADAATLRAEFQRSGIVPPERGRPVFYV